jgi:hypothetical protein
MNKYNQSQIQRQVEILVTNGKLEQAQAILATISYDPAVLETGQALLQAWLTYKIRAQALLAEQKQATQAQQEALRQAQAELTHLSETVRVLFSQDQVVLTSLGLLPRRSSNGSNGTEPAPDETGDGTEGSNGNGQVRSGLTRSLAGLVARWRLPVANISTLSEAQQAELNAAGWSAGRVAAASELVEACAAADTAQQQKIQTYRAGAVTAREAETALRHWSSQAARLTRLAIRTADPDDREQLHELLGL